MKPSIILLVSILILVCSCNPKLDNSEAVFNTTWELEYMSGPRIAFDGLFPEKKPQITFNKETHQVTGTDSCNGYSADFELDENSISFGEPGPTTMMFCGGGERQFLNMMQKIDGYIIQDGELNLMAGEVPMMRFKKVEQ
ncbi:META domain-containing protein [Muricauda sp. MAR_2010_75]|jgi:heat shock protein HslJ|uniref:META domain-containing protein n=1 Tax=Allomuricauda sp. MAR_2010_75 TaxID=1250232 RepID=UPI00055A3AFA|nr:META domain-containing protein [Muricauda sp. MAR_2010_75]